MSDQEKQAAKEMARTLTKAMEILTTNQQERVVGIVQGMAMMADAQTASKAAKTTKA